jgi:hypothetical protein
MRENRPVSKTAAIEPILARLNSELLILDSAGFLLTAAKLSEACETLKREIEARPIGLPVEPALRPEDGSNTESSSHSRQK